ncbi:Tad domain-containing protein [Sphingobium sp. BYY-5]|nr:Tad domain-containing protein [Sphingobium sp. BYY-5]
MVGGAVDISRGYLAQTRLQQACDAGVLAGRKAMGSSGVLSDSVTGEVTKFVRFNFPSTYLGTPPNITVAPTLGANDTIQLTLASSVPTAVMGLFGKANMAITASCTARNDYSNIDIVLVLDVTGSMGCKPEWSEQTCQNNAKYVTTNIPGMGKSMRYVEEVVENSINVSRIQALRTALASLQTQMATIETQFNMTEEGKRKRVRWAIVPFAQMVNAGFSTGSAGTTLWSRQPSWFNTTGTYYNDRTPGTSVGHSNTWMTSTWDGCVEERRTSNTITKTSGHSIPDNLPSTADDLKFDTSPTSTQTRWTVADPASSGSAGSTGYACPKPMRELAPMTATDFNNYFAFDNGFIANGGTYLDTGLLWAARLLSRTGLWRDDNPTLYHTFPISRYVIFMTDGQMQTGTSTYSTSYSSHGPERYALRVTTNGTTSQNNSNRTARMLMTCTAIKNMDVKIYSISFSSGSTLSSDLINCSSSTNTINPEFAYKADNSAQLNKVFRDIGENIGSLRLSQ